MATEPTAIAQARMAKGAYGPTFAARAAGTTNIEAPTTMLTMLEASPHAPTVRINPASRVLVSIGRTVPRMFATRRHLAPDARVAPHRRSQCGFRAAPCSRLSTDGEVPSIRRKLRRIRSALPKPADRAITWA